jgi:hypothetical protein
MIFNVNSLNRHFKNLARKTRSWDIVVRNKELRSEAGAASLTSPVFRQVYFAALPRLTSIFNIPCSVFNIRSGLMAREIEYRASNMKRG